MNKEQRAAAIALLANMWEVDAIQFAIVYRKAYDVDLDWHEFAYLLDDLHAQGKVAITRAGGMTAYRWQ